MKQDTNPKSSADSSHPGNKPETDDVQSSQTREVPAFEVASNLSQVISAWSLVHNAYHRIGLIDTNKYGLHTVTQAAGPDSVVVLGTVDDAPVSTLTVIQDGPQKVPLQQVYPKELDLLRSQGRKLMEVGLLADRREQISRAMVSIFAMMRFVFWHSYRTHQDIVIGVHPHHAGFYINSFGFETIGMVSTHPTVKDHPVLPLRLDLHTVLAGANVPKRLTHYLNNPLPEDAFDHRYRFEEKEVKNSPLGMYLHAKKSLATQIRNAS